MPGIERIRALYAGIGDVREAEQTGIGQHVLEARCEIDDIDIDVELLCEPAELRIESRRMLRGKSAGHASQTAFHDNRRRGEVRDVGHQIVFAPAPASAWMLDWILPVTTRRAGNLSSCRTVLPGREKRKIVVRTTEVNNDRRGLEIGRRADEGIDLRPDAGQGHVEVRKLMSAVGEVSYSSARRPRRNSGPGLGGAPDEAW